MPNLIRQAVLVPLLAVGIAVAPMVLGTAGCTADGQAQSAVTADRRASLRVDGMTCASCSVTVRVAATKLDGIALVEVDVEGGAATVSFDSTKVTAEQIAAAISEAGYAATVVSDQAVGS